MPLRCGAARLGGLGGDALPQDGRVREGRHRRKTALPRRRRRGRFAVLRLPRGERRRRRAEHRLLRLARPGRARPGLRRRGDESPRRRKQLPRRPNKEERSRSRPFPHDTPRHSLAGDARTRRENRHRHARVRIKGDLTKIQIRATRLGARFFTIDVSRSACLYL